MMMMMMMKVVGVVVVEEEAQDALCSVTPHMSSILCHMHTLTWVFYILNILQCQGEPA
jgi:hypothetical protein